MGQEQRAQKGGNTISQETLETYINLEGNQRNTDWDKKLILPIKLQKIETINHPVIQVTVKQKLLYLPHGRIH